MRKGGKNASVEKNYPIMPKARRNYERCFTWPGPALENAIETQPFKCRGGAAKCQINRTFQEKNLSRFVSSRETRSSPREQGTDWY